jgi:hypothetical protein
LRLCGCRAINNWNDPRLSAFISFYLSTVLYFGRGSRLYMIYYYYYYPGFISGDLLLNTG